MTWRQVLWLLCALFGLNLALTLQDVWPTPGVQWAGELSVELATLLLLLAVCMHFGKRLLRGWAPALAALMLVLTLGRYAAITAPALYGRPINLYWDFEHVGNVAGMLGRVAPWWAVVALVLVVMLLLALLYAGFLWCWRRVLDGLAQRRVAGLLSVVAVVVLAGFAAQRAADVPLGTPPFTEPVTHTYAVQLRMVLNGLSGQDGSGQLPASPNLQSGLSALHGADVLLLFLESYGSSTYDNPAFHAGLAPARTQLLQSINETGRTVMSAFVTSPTFGGNSWLAHLSLMSGIQVTEPGRYALLMTQTRDTLATAFRDHGYRTVAMMPGLRLAWPEGSFYHFDTIHDSRSLAYQGPPFGWFVIPDQYSLARLDELELQPHPRPPVFAMFPTLSTHLPFRPTPPYQPDWGRISMAQPYDAVPLQAALAETPDWFDMGRSYVAAMDYTTRLLAGYLHERPDPSLVLVVLGDHQPAANVSGEGASWDVPVHVITGNAQVLAALRKAGFVSGLEPQRQSLGEMSSLAPLLLRAFNFSEGM